MTRRSKARMTLAATAGALLLLAGAGAAFAQQSPSPDLNQMVRALDAPSFAAREGATNALAGDLSISDERVAKQLERSDLTPEQSWRILEVLRRRFLSTPRGAIGIQYNQQTVPPQIIAVLPNFPATQAGLIRPGDVILSIEGRSMEGAVTVMREETFSRDPGDTLHLRIQRTDRVPDADADEAGKADGEAPKPAEAQVQIQPVPGQPQAQGIPVFPKPGDPGTVTREFDIEVELGSLANFAERANVNGLELDRALAVRLARMGITLPTERVEPEVAPEAWNEAMIPTPAQMEHWSRVISGPMQVELEVARYAGRMAAAQQTARQNARLIRQLDQARVQNNADIVNALNQRAGINNGAPNQPVRQIIVQPQQPRQLIEAQERFRAKAAAMQRLQAGVGKADTPADPAQAMPSLPADSIGEANRLAARIGELEGQIASRVRTMRASGTDDPNVRRLSEAQIEELRGKLQTLRARLVDVMEGRVSTDVEASMDGE